MPHGKYRLVSRRTEVDHMPCRRCGCKNKTVDGLTVHNEVIGYSAKCCKCGNVEVFHKKHYGHRKQKYISENVKHIRYGAVRCSNCKHIRDCKLYAEGRCIRIEHRRRFKQPHDPYKVTSKYTTKFNPNAINVEQVENPKYK